MLEDNLLVLESVKAAPAISPGGPDVQGLPCYFRVAGWHTAAEPLASDHT